MSIRWCVPFFHGIKKEAEAEDIFTTEGHGKTRKEEQSEAEATEGRHIFQSRMRERR